MPDNTASFDRFIEGNPWSDEDILKLISAGDREAMAYLGWRKTHHAMIDGGDFDEDCRYGESLLVKAASEGRLAAVASLVRLYDNIGEKEKYNTYLLKLADMGDIPSRYKVAVRCKEAGDYGAFLKYAESCMHSKDTEVKRDAAERLKEYYIELKDYKRALYWAKKMKSPFDGSPSQKDIDEVKSLIRSQKPDR